MGKYSRKGSAAFDAKLDADFADVVAQLTASPDAAKLQALVLIGGYGRSEGTPYICGDQQLPFNDYDFVVVSEAMSRKQRQAVQARLQQLEKSLTVKLGIPVDLCLYPRNEVKRAEFSLLNYEMKYGHKVIWGAPDILQDMPAYAHEAIPRSEGTRLLLNRGKLLLDIRRALRTPAPLPPDERLRYIKFIYKAFLALGDCALLLLNHYDLSYAVKQSRIDRIAASQMPNPAYVIANYKRAIAFKEWGDCTTLDTFDLATEFECVRKEFCSFFMWYESQRMGKTCADLASYATALTQTSPECPRWKSLLLNVQFFKTKTLALGARFADMHPRARLYLAVLSLLSDEPINTENVQRILACDTPDRNRIEHCFFQLQKRFS